MIRVYWGPGVPIWQWFGSNPGPDQKQCSGIIANTTSDLVHVIYIGHIGSFYWRKRSQHGHRPILILSVNGAWMIFSIASWVIYVLIGCRHPFIRHWKPLLAKTTTTCSLRHPENEHQRSVNSLRYCILCIQGIARIFARITTWLTIFRGKNTICRTWNTDTKLIDNTNSTTWKSALMVAENVILIRYN